MVKSIEEEEKEAVAEGAKALCWRSVLCRCAFSSAFSYSIDAQVYHLQHIAVA